MRDDRGLFFRCSYILLIHGFFAAGSDARFAVLEDSKSKDDPQYSTAAMSELKVHDLLRL
jgi:hypothetical protein